MRKSLHLIFLFIIGCTLTIKGQSLIISEKIEEQKLEDFAKVYTTSEREITLNQISPSDWTKSSKGTNFGMVNEIHWVKYEFNNPTNQSIELNFYLPYHHIREVDFYFNHGKDTNKIGEFGTTRYYYKKEKQTPGYVKKISFPSGRSTLYLKFKHINIPLRANAFLLSDSRTEAVIKTSETSFRAWRIILLFAFIISLIAYLITKIKIFLYYLILNTGVILFIGMEIGEFFQLFNIDRYYTIIDIKHLGDLLVLLVFPLFLNELTPIKKLNPKAWRVIMNLTYLGCVLWAIGLIPQIKQTQFFYYSVWFLIVQTSIVFLAQLYFLFVTLIKKQKNSTILFVLYLVYIFAVTFEVILPNIGSRSDDIFVYNILLKSSIVEVIFFLFLMGKEMYTIFKDRNNLLIEQKKLQQEMLKAVVTSQENERNTLGRELHDMIGANMSVVKQHIDKSNSGLVKIMDDTIDSVRSLSHGLMTPKVEGDQLKDEIIDLCLLSSNESFKANYYFHHWEPLKNKESSTHLYRIVQELLQNTLKHSGANEAYIQIIRNNNKVTLLYEDNGKGFDAEKLRKKGKGLLGIEHRTEILKGILRYDSSRKGTSIELNFKD